MAVSAALNMPLDVSGGDAFDTNVPLASLVGMQSAPGMGVQTVQQPMASGIMMPMMTGAPSLNGVGGHVNGYSGLPVAVAAVGAPVANEVVNGNGDVKPKKQRKPKTASGTAAAGGESGKKTRKRKSDAPVVPKATMSVQEQHTKKRRRKVLA